MGWNSGCLTDLFLGMKASVGSLDYLSSLYLKALAG